MAQDACEEALATMRAAVSVRNTVLPLTNLGYIVARRGDLLRARALFTESLGLALEHSFRFVVASCLGGLGLLRAQTEPEHGVRLCGAAAAVFAATGATLWPVELITYTDQLEPLRSALGPERFAAAWEAGQAMTVE